MSGQWSIVVDFDPDGRVEATAWVSEDENDQLHWESSDPHTLMAAIGRDLATEILLHGGPA